MSYVPLAVASLLTFSALAAIAPTGTAVGWCSSAIHPNCPALVCYGTSGPPDDVQCQQEVPDELCDIILCPPPPPPP